MAIASLLDFRLQGVLLILVPTYSVLLLFVMFKSLFFTSKVSTINSVIYQSQTIFKEN